MDEEEKLRRAIAAAIKDGIRDGMSAAARAQNNAKSGKTTSNFGGSSIGSRSFRVVTRKKHSLVNHLNLVLAN